MSCVLVLKCPFEIVLETIANDLQATSNKDIATRTERSDATRSKKLTNFPSDTFPSDETTCRLVVVDNKSSRSLTSQMVGRSL